MLRSGQYPPDPHPAQTRTRNLKSPYENPCLIAAEIESRLKNCGRHGKSRHYYGEIIEQIYCQYLDGTDDLFRLAGDFNMTLESLSRTENKLIRYISGWKRKPIPFNVWRSKRSVVQNLGHKEWGMTETMPL